MQLPLNLTDEQSARIYDWAKQNCLQSNIIRENDGEGFLLIVERADERDTRNRQRLMSTNYKHWGIDASKQPKGWLKVLTGEEFNALNKPGDACDSEGNSSENAGDDTEIAAADLTTMAKLRKDTNNTPDLTPVLAFSRCTYANLELPLPPNLLSYPAFFIDVR